MRMAKYSIKVANDMMVIVIDDDEAVSYTHLRAHET